MFAVTCSLTLVGTTQRVSCDFRWEGGAPTSEEEFGLAVLGMEAALRGWVGPPTGPTVYGRENILSDELACWCLIQSVFQDVVLVDGRIPSVPEIPEGAVA